MVFQFLFSIILQCNILDQSHPKSIIFWAKVWITNSPDFQFHYVSWFRTLTFPEITLFKISKQLRQNVNCFFLALYQCIKSLFKVTEVVAYFLGQCHPKCIWPSPKKKWVLVK